jgi:hypothetical protein
MSRRRLRPRVLTAAAAATALLAGAATAWAAPPSVERVSTAPAPYFNQNDPTPTFTITGATPDEVVNWSATGPGGFATSGSVAGSGTVQLDGILLDGSGSITATTIAVEPNPPESTTLDFVVDRTAPTAAATLVGTPNAAGWYRVLSLDPACSDATSGPPTCVIEPFTSGTGPQQARISSADGAGNPNNAGLSPVFRFDNVAPAASGGQPMEPVSASVVPEPPRFSWSEGVDGHSGVARYLLQVKAPSADWQTVATVAHGGAVEYSATSSEPLPVDQLFRWRVVTVDVAGNSTESNEYLLTIDPDVAPAPKMTGGPLGPTRNNSPTFTWQTTSSRWDYAWDVTAAGNPTVVRQGSGQGLNRATVPSLPDGDYTFRVVQVINGVPSASATRAFKVDTLAPAPPGITARPPFPASSPVGFAWTTEPGAYSRWEVVAAGGLLAAGPSDTPLNSATIFGLGEGAYSFRVLQVDPAGNVSQWTTEPFTVVGAVLPGPPGPTAAPSGSLVSSLPRQNAKRLRPKAGKTLPTRRPVLRWSKGPRGTQLYNLQIFQVAKQRKGAKSLTPKVTKIHSAFPRSRQYRAPKSKMKPNTCYVWRVWPYTGRKFTAKPLGVSNFCIANKKVLAKKAAQAKVAKRKAAARRAAAARGDAARR